MRCAPERRELGLGKGEVILRTREGSLKNVFREGVRPVRTRAWDKTDRTRMPSKPQPGSMEMPDRGRGNGKAALLHLAGGTNCDGGKVSGRRHTGGEVCDAVTQPRAMGRAEAEAATARARGNGQRGPSSATTMSTKQVTCRSVRGRQSPASPLRASPPGFGRRLSFSRAARETET